MRDSWEYVVRDDKACAISEVCDVDSRDLY